MTSSERWRLEQIWMDHRNSSYVRYKHRSFSVSPTNQSFPPPPPPQPSTLKYQSVVYCMSQISPVYCVYTTVVYDGQFSMLKWRQRTIQFLKYFDVCLYPLSWNFQNTSRFFIRIKVYIFPSIRKIVRIGLKMNMSVWALGWVAVAKHKTISWPQKISSELKVNKTQKQRRN